MELCIQSVAFHLFCFVGIFVSFGAVSLFLMLSVMCSFEGVFIRMLIVDVKGAELIFSGLRMVDEKRKRFIVFIFVIGVRRMSDRRNFHQIGGGGEVTVL